MSNPLRSSGDASPFIKREQLRRDFLRSRLKKNSTPKPFVKKEESDVMDERTRQLMQNGGRDSGVYVKNEPEKEYNEFPLRAITTERLENMRTHILKFQSKKKIDPTKDFHLPIRLHRKDTRNLQFQLTRAEIVQRQKEILEYKKKLEDEQINGNPAQSVSPGPDSAAVPATPSTAATPGAVTPGAVTPGAATLGATTPAVASPAIATPVVATPAIGTPATGTPVGATSIITPEVANLPVGQTRLEEAGPATDPTKVGMVKYDGKEQAGIGFEQGTTDPLADVAPDGGGRFRRGNSKRKTRQLKLLDEKAKRLRFEEFYPWVMEDFDGYNTWVGSYEAGNSDSYVLLSVENDGSFTMIPADKVYKFTARNKYATLTIEEAEKRMEKNGAGAPRWLMKHLDDIGTTTTRYDRTKRRLKAVDGNNRQDDGEDRGDNSEVELDYDEEFADDEEAPIIDGNEEENKESEQRIKREMLQANAMGLRDNDEFDHEDLFGEKKIDEEGERVKKALQKSDMAALYESDDDSKINPYLSESDVENKEQNSIKREDDGDSSLGSKKSSPRKKSPRSTPTAPQIFVKSIKDFMVVLKADKSILGNFPGGDWSPDAKKRKLESNDEFSNKKRKHESDTDPNLLTAQDIIEKVTSRRMTLKELIKELKEKVGKHPSNKERMKQFVKKLVKLNDGYLELNK